MAWFWTYIRAWFRRPAYMPVHGEIHDDLVSLAVAVQHGIGCWGAKERGECGTCGHEWIPGEVIGIVQQAYVRTDDGNVYRRPATRIVCGLCVEQQRAQGDLSIRWAREAGLL